MPERLDPPLRADEATTLLAFLDYHRETLRTKVRGVSDQGLAATTAASTMTLGGLLKHMALVESSWFSRVLWGEPEGEPWDSVDWDADRDWEWHTAAQDSSEDLFALYEAAVARSDASVARALEAGGVDQLSVKNSRSEDAPFSLRWILLHMIEEYARHNGHADLLRESVDGEVGE
ncbi:MAG: DinB family protein [Marmoricola sp.]